MEANGLSVLLTAEGPKGSAGLYFMPTAAVLGEHQTYMFESTVKFSQVQ